MGRNGSFEAQPSGADFVDPDGVQRGIAVAVDLEVAEHAVVDAGADEVLGDARAVAAGLGDGVEQELGGLGVVDRVAAGQLGVALLELGLDLLAVGRAGWWWEGLRC